MIGRLDGTEKKHISKIGARLEHVGWQVGTENMHILKIGAEPELNG